MRLSYEIGRIVTFAVFHLRREIGTAIYFTAWRAMLCSCLDVSGTPMSARVDARTARKRCRRRSLQPAGGTSSLRHSGQIRPRNVFISSASATDFFQGVSPSMSPQASRRCASRSSRAIFAGVVGNPKQRSSGIVPPPASQAEQPLRSRSISRGPTMPAASWRAKPSSPIRQAAPSFCFFLRRAWRSLGAHCERVGFHLCARLARRAL